MHPMYPPIYRCILGSPSYTAAAVQLIAEWLSHWRQTASLCMYPRSQPSACILLWIQPMPGPWGSAECLPMYPWSPSHCLYLWNTAYCLHPGSIFLECMLPGTLESILPVSQKPSLLPALLEFFLLPVSLETKLRIHSLEFILLPVCVYPLSQSYGLYPKSLLYISDWQCLYPWSLQYITDWQCLYPWSLQYISDWQCLYPWSPAIAACIPSGT